MRKSAQKKVIVLVPCYNEAGGIADVIKRFPIAQLRAQDYKLEIVVIDNNSTDKTGDIARALGVTVLHEPKKGKGNAIRRGFAYVSDSTDFVVMLDGDVTYRPEEIVRLLEPLKSGFCNVVIGSRLGGRIAEGSMKPFNRMGNWIYSHLVRYAYQVNVTDVLTGYFAWTRQAVYDLRPHLKSDGFAIEMEMITKMAKLGEEVYSVPISYQARAGESNLRPIHDGIRILWMFAKNLLWRPKAQPMQRIAFVSDAVLPYNKGGKEKRLYEISKRLVKAHREVHIYTMKWWDGPKHIMHDGVHFHAISKLYPLYNGERRSIFQAIMFGLATYKLLFKKFDVLDVDHIPFFPLFTARIVAWIRGKKLYATWHEVWGWKYWMKYLKGPVGLIGYAIEWLSIRVMMPDVIISSSVHTTNRLRAIGFKGDIKTIPLGVDLKNIFSAEAGADESDIIFVGRLLGHKNADLLVKAIAIVKNTKEDISCRIVGNGPEKTRIRQLIKKLNVAENVHILDSIKRYEDVYSLMKASKMLVLPSIREGFGLVIIEANAAGLPVITTSHEDNAAKELVTEGVNGLLAEPNEHDIAKKILQILEIRKTMKPKHGIEEYDWRIVCQQIERAIE